MFQSIRNYWNARNRAASQREIISYWKEKIKGIDEPTYLWWRIRERSENPELVAYWRMQIRASETQIIGKIPYLSKSEEMGDYRERLRPGVFTKSLKSGRDVYFLWSHDHSKPLGSTKSGTLKLKDTPTGLEFELTPGQTTVGRDALESVRRGDVKGVSFGFNIEKYEWDRTGSIPIRDVLEAELFELSGVVWPAYGGTKILARNAIQLNKIEAT